MNTGGPAFPIEINSEMTCLGMTLRDYFASKAMEKLMVGTLPYDLIAKYAYEMADEMLKVKEKS